MSLKNLNTKECDITYVGLHSAVGNEFDSISRGCKVESQLSLITFVEIDHENISAVILPVPLIQDWQLSDVMLFHNNSMLLYVNVIVHILLHVHNYVNYLED